MNISYQLYQAERTHSAAEQREIDAQAGEFAAAISRAGRAAWRAATRHQGTGRRGTRRAGQRVAPPTVSCAIPRPR